MLNKVKKAVFRMAMPVRNKKGMEMVQVAILVAIAVAVGIIFKSSVTDFVNKIFGNLNAANF
jgi:hypothetical protein